MPLWNVQLLTLMKKEQNKSELFVSLTKIVGRFTDEFVSRRKFFFADVEAIVGPIAVVPNFGAENNKCSLTKERETWRNDFISWLEARPSEQEIEAEKHAHFPSDEQQNFGTDIEESGSEDETMI